MDETDSDASAPLSVSPVLRRLKKLDLDHCRNDSTGQYETFFAYSGMKADMQRRVSAPAAISPATMSMPLNLARRNSGAEPMGTSSLRATTSTPPARSGRRPTVSNLADVPHELDLGGAGGDRAANSEHDDAQSLPTPSHLRRSAAPSFMRPGSCVPDEGDPDDEDDASSTLSTPSVLRRFRTETMPQIHRPPVVQCPAEQDDAADPSSTLSTPSVIRRGALLAMPNRPPSVHCNDQDDADDPSSCLSTPSYIRRGAASATRHPIEHEQDDADDGMSSCLSTPSRQRRGSAPMVRPPLDADQTTPSRQRRGSAPMLRPPLDAEVCDLDADPLTDSPASSPNVSHRLRRRSSAPGRMRPPAFDETGQVPIKSPTYLRRLSEEALVESDPGSPTLPVEEAGSKVPWVPLTAELMSAAGVTPPVDRTDACPGKRMRNCADTSAPEVA